MIKPATPHPNHGGHLYYVVPAVAMRSDSGRDNPFRPDGDISREADEIVERIKSGRPLDVADAAASPTSPSAPVEEPLLTSNEAPAPQSSPPSLPPSQPSPPPATTGVNGSAAASGGEKGGGGGSPSPAAVEVTHAHVTPSHASQVEHVVIKKKSKCNCCVIQ